ncbi:TonB-linked SusC/RagA family outer membrane protein [Maribacter vaceletii]|uniref:TonB-linked SusC/RagA family outer membrane protein n=1 Tax=Maribacter vaceletii TaxID=1206816 RepID=A0A495E674_9FLAO|nr:TonB-dependent receptor [Maribacter vaceletii]RKR12201.1 TonB-linked SusC/RagA family outer membrane protein [Maribacter vaceletii]
MKKKCKTNTYSASSFSLKGSKGYRMSVLKMICCGLLLGLTSVSYANLEAPLSKITFNEDQEITINGNVSDELGPLAGVTVMVKGTTNGTSTDFDGNYSINVEGSNAVLVFSYIGYKDKEVTIGSNTTVNVVLEQDVAGLDEVVVVGYSTKKRGELTGSVSTISSEAIAQTSSKDVAKSLAGRASGLIISDRGGVPGAGNGAGGNTQDDATTILIRGKSTLGNNSPLILIDGVPSESFSQLAPQDIASLTVLKDGAAAIYGSRAANGVILVTTKRGKSGKPSINFSTSYNVSSFTKRPHLMDMRQFATYRNEVLRRDDPNAAPAFTEEDIVNSPNTDWADLTLASSSPESRTSLSVSGGTDKAKYFVSGDFIDQKGLFRSGALGFKQYQIRSNVDVNITDDFKLGVDLSARFGKSTAPGVDNNNIYKLIFGTPPDEIGRYPNGLPARGGDEGNPILTSSNASGFDNNYRNNITGRFTVDYNLDKILKGLSIKGFTGFRKLNTDSKSWYTPWTFYAQQDDGTFTSEIGSNQTGQERILREDFTKFDEQIYNARIHYSNIFGDHSVNTFVGMERIDNESSNFFAQKIGGFPNPTSGELFQGNNGDTQSSSGTSSEFKRQDFFGSLSYDYDKRYFIDLTLRHDGSSRFGEGKRYGTFPSAAVSWSIGNEKFLENSSWINALKLRASWSEMGNDRIGPNQFLSLFDYGTNVAGNNPLGAPIPNYYIFGETGTNFLNTYNVNRLANTDVTWETAQMQNIGLNFTLFENKLSGDINYFYQKRADILVSRGAEIPQFIGLQTSQIPDENVGETKSYGFEFELAWNDALNDNFSYNIGMNFTQAKNEVVSLPEGSNISDELKRSGKPIDSYIVYPTNGIFRDQAQVDATPIKRAGTVEGEPIYTDTNGDNVVNDDDRIRTSTSAIPEIQYGVYGGINYKDFSLNFLFQGQAEAETLVYFDSNGTSPEFVFNERWTPENRNSIYPRAFARGDAYSAVQNEVPGQPNGGFQGADIYYFDASFVRLKEVELAYTIKKDIIKGADIRLFARGYNLATFYSDIWDLGLDPEATGYYNFQSALYTPLKTYTLGVNFSF